MWPAPSTWPESLQIAGPKVPVRESWYIVHGANGPKVTTSGSPSQLQSATASRIAVVVP